MIGGGMTQERGLGGCSASVDSFSELLQDVVLSVAKVTDESDLRESLQRVRAFFGYEVAFVYELGTADDIILQACVSESDQSIVPTSFLLNQVLTDEQLHDVAQNPLYRSGEEAQDRGILDALENLFRSKNVFVLFVLNDEDTIVACVGMTAAHDFPPLSREEAVLLKVALTPFAQSACLHACERRLDYTSGTLESIMDHIGFDIYVNDFDTHKLLYANKSMAEPYGGWESMRGKACFKALYDDRDAECEYCPKKHLIDEEGNPSKIYSWDYQRPFDGRWFRVISAAFQWTDGSLAHVISSTDINEAKENELLVKKMAYYDLLTDIPNRRRLERDLNGLIEANRQTKTPIAVMFLDLNSFKGVNDHYGHSGGDALLRHVSQLFSEHPLTSGHCYRYGGDEFIFLLDRATPEGIDSVKTAVVEMLATPFQLQGDTLTCSGSIGVACYPLDGSTYWELLDKADDAMYEKKQRNGSSRGLLN